jgi:hypothetical protein
MSRKRGAIPPLPNTPWWRVARLKKSTGTTLSLCLSMSNFLSPRIVLYKVWTDRAGLCADFLYINYKQPKKTNISYCTYVDTAGHRQGLWPVTRQTRSLDRGDAPWETKLGYEFRRRLDAKTDRQTDRQTDSLPDRPTVVKWPWFWHWRYALQPRR